MVQWLRLHPSTAGGAGLIPGWGTIPHPICCVAWPKDVKNKSIMGMGKYDILLS